MANSVSRRRFLATSAASTAVVAGGVSGRVLSAGAQEAPAATPVVPAEPGFQVLFIRHGQSEVNVLPRGKAAAGFPPDDGVTYPLTALGVTEVMDLADALANVPVSAIYTSPRLRCVQTSDAIALSKGLTITVAPAIVELSFGDVNPGQVNVEELFAVNDAWLAGDGDARGPLVESFNEMRDRFVPFVTETVAAHAEDPRTLIFVAHGGILATMLPLVLDNVSPEFASFLGEHALPNTGIVRVEMRGGQLTCMDWAGSPPA